MKKFILGALMIFTIVSGYSQERGLHLTLGGGLGLQSFNYDMGEDGRVGSKLGYSFGIGAQYYFTRYVGIGVGLNLSRYKTTSTYDSAMFVYKELIDDYDGREYESRIRLRNWKENQTTYFLDIPVMFLWQKKFDRREQFGMYFGAGLKFQIPIESTYKVRSGILKATAYFEDFEVDFGNIDLPEQGLGTNNTLRPSGNNNLRLGMGLAGELGFLITFSPRVDLMLGVSADYGLLNIKKKTNNTLASPIEDAQLAATYAGENVAYKGILNTRDIGKIHPYTVRGNIGIKIKIGKLKDRKEEEEEEGRVIRCCPDTIIVTPIIEMPQIIFPEIYGMPPAIAAPVPAEDMDIILSPIYFDLDKYVLTDESKDILNRKAALLKKYPQVDVAIFGHTCDIASEPYNDKLGLNRANAARSYLIKKGIKSSRITIISEGLHNPDVPNFDEAFRRLNRKAEFILAE